MLIFTPTCNQSCDAHNIIITQNGNTALSRAREEGHEDIVKLLQQYSK